MEQKIKEIRENSKIKRKPHKNVHKIINTYNLENPKKFKKIIRENRIKEFTENQAKNKNKQKRGSKFGSHGKQKIELFNFRKKKA